SRYRAARTAYAPIPRCSRSWRPPCRNFVAFINKRAACEPQIRRGPRADNVLCVRRPICLDSETANRQEPRSRGPLKPIRTAPVRHLPIPILRCLTLGVAILASGLAARPAAAEASLIVEAATGKVLHAEHATYPWYPASTTKLMTMYLTLKAVKDKR